MSKIGRNDPCPCGSGKKYKKCCLSKDEVVRAKELVSVSEMSDTELDRFLDVPEECWVCGKPVNPFGIMGGDEVDEMEPDGVTLRAGEQLVTVHAACMDEAQKRLDSVS